MTKKMAGFPVCPVSLARHCIGENKKETDFSNVCTYLARWIKRVNLIILSRSRFNQSNTV